MLLITLKDYNNLLSYNLSMMFFNFKNINNNLVYKKIKQIISLDELFSFESQISFSGFYDTPYLFSSNFSQEFAHYSQLSRYWQEFQLFDKMEDYGNLKKFCFIGVI